MGCQNIEHTSQYLHTPKPTQKNTSISQNERRHTTTSGAGKIITPLCFACGQQEETWEHLRYDCEHRRYETETQQVCEEWKVVFAGWKDVPDAVMQYGIALAKETAAGRQREKGPTSPAHHDGYKNMEALGIQGDMERQDVVQQESEAGQPAKHLHVRRRENAVHVWTDGKYGAESSQVKTEAQERVSTGARETPQSFRMRSNKRIAPRAKRGKRASKHGQVAA